MSYLWILLLISFIASAIGWAYFVYFFSVGYGFAISALAIASAIIFRDSLSLPSIILCSSFTFYGIRLALYLLLREKHSSSYKKILYQPDNTKKKPIPTMLMIWIFCTLLYVGQISPITFYLHNTTQSFSTSIHWLWIGTIVTLTGIIIEIVADIQKNSAKKKMT